MAGFAHIARPWLLLTRSPMRVPTTVSPYLGLGYSRGISVTTARRSARVETHKTFKRKAEGARRDWNKIVTSEVMNSLLLPYTIVPPPVWRFPRSPIKFARMVWLIAKNRAVSLGSRLSVYLMSMRTNGVGWPKFKSGKKSCIPAAKALHAQMSEAVAAGDRETLRRICSPELFQTLAGAIDARPPGTRTEWELVRYDNKLRYPRIADFRIAYQPLGTSKQMRVLKQAVVSISSVQRLTRYDKSGALIPGSERERYMMEHLVLQAPVKDVTYETGPWQIWGTLPEMSFETMCTDIAIFSEALANQGRNRA
ncbi:hypothetical protein FHL15_005073 [Xylaria flabelliformis]|uniref:Uncharacterized protein n=1 Tax=Xylaria flabelliformis TaxID=2512241 RepID=A0A553I1B0_9PEZI|nr:hypothetical protein FHL15_005073 [Xylaria flabelliformis]